MARMDRDKLGEQLSAYLDGELNDEDRAAVEVTLQDDPSARAELARLRETAHAASELPRRGAPGSLAADVMATIERGDLLDDAAPLPKTHGWSWRSLNALLVTAAMIAVVITVGLWGMSQRENKRSASIVVSSAETDGMERAVLDSEPQRPETLRESLPAEIAVPPVLALAPRPVPTEYYDAKVDEVVQAAPPLLKAKVFGRSASGRSGIAVGVHAAADVHIDVTCPNEVDLRRCADRVNEFILLHQGQPRSESRRSIVAVPPHGIRRSGQNDGFVTVAHTLRIPSSRLRSLVDALEAGDLRQRGVVLTIGTMVRAQGWRQSRQLSEMVFAQAMHDEPHPLMDQPYSQESRRNRPNRIRGRTRPTVVRGIVGGTAEGDAKTTESRRALDEWFERFGVHLPRAAESKEATATPAAGSMERDQRSAPEQLISVTVRFRAPADPPPPGPPGQLVPRDR